MGLLGKHRYSALSHSTKENPDEEELIAAALAPQPHSQFNLRTLLIAVGVIGFFPLFLTTVDRNHQAPGPESDVSGFCNDARAIPLRAAKKNIWKNLDLDEAVAVRRWLFAPEQGLNLTESTRALTKDNTVFLVEAHRPTKRDALNYFDAEGPVPTKFAHAVVHHSTSNPPVIIDYLIGPLPVGPKTTMRPLSENYAMPEVPMSARTFLRSDFADMSTFLHRVFGPLGELTMDLFGVRADGYANDTLIATSSSPVSFDGEWRRIWMPLKLNVPGSYLHSLDCYVYVEMTGLDVADWEVLKVVYNHQIFNTVDDFVKAWKDKTLVRSPKALINDTDWATRTPKGFKRDLDHLAGPRSVMFDGPRFRADVDEQFITWMGWSMYFGFERDMGLSLWNVGFRGERLIYELMPQEALAQYSGNDPGQSSTVWLDRAFGMGALVKEMMVGYDCAANALYLPATVHTSMGSTIRSNAICVFEQDSGRPLSRHVGEDVNEMGSTKGYQLVVRTITTAGNYDYIWDYTFQYDGTLEVRFSASGYLQGNYWDPKRDAFGTRIRETTQGALHDHVINFKIDLDVAGPANTVSTIALEVQEIEQEWFADDWGSSNVQQAIVKTKHLNESTTKFENPKNGQGMIVISNEEESNAWGNPRAYALHTGASNVHLTNLNNKRTLKNVQWAKHHAFVTREKATEPYSSSMWNMNLPGKPPVDFDAFFDDESLDQEDLVLWVNLGTHHIPRAEDSPHTLTNLATSYLLLTPFNYNDFDVSMESQNAVMLNPSEDSSLWTSSGHIQPDYCIPRKLPKFTYTGMIGYHENGTLATPGDVHDYRMDTHAIHDFKAVAPL